MKVTHKDERTTSIFIPHENVRKPETFPRGIEIDFVLMSLWLGFNRYLLTDYTGFEKVCIK